MQGGWTDINLRIAQVDVRVKYEARRIAVAPTLEPFHLADVTVDVPQLVLDFTAKTKDRVRELTALPSCGPLLAARRVPAGLVFQWPSGCMLASPDFSCCSVWGHDSGSPPQEQFGGRPWLMLALWGYLSQRHGILLHGAVCALGDRYIMLLGDQQVGKSALGRLVVEAGYACLTDENAVLTWADGAAWAHGTPWPGVAGNPKALSGPLSAMFFLRHAAENVLERLSPREGGQCLLRNARFFVWDPTTVPVTIELLDRTARSVPIYDFGFVPTLDAVHALREVL